MKPVVWGALAASLFAGGDVLAKNNSLGLDFGFFAESRSSESFAVLTPVFDGRVKLAKRLSLKFVLPMTVVDAPDDDGMIVRLGNPYGGLAWEFTVDDTVKIGLGGGVTLPAARVPGRDDGGVPPAQTAFNAASNSRGRYDQWHWQPEALSLVGPIDITIDLGLLIIRTDAALALLLPTGGERTETILQFGGTGLVTLGSWSVGARVQSVWQPTTADEETSQTSVGPLAEVDLSPVVLWSTFVFNIEGPAGTSFSGEGFWSFRLGGKVVF